MLVYDKLYMLLLFLYLINGPITTSALFTDILGKAGSQAKYDKEVGGNLIMLQLSFDEVMWL